MDDIRFFISCLRDFPDFTDESLYDALADFEDEAKVSRPFPFSQFDLKTNGTIVPIGSIEPLQK